MSPETRTGSKISLTRKKNTTKSMISESTNDDKSFKLLIILDHCENIGAVKIPKSHFLQGNSGREGVTTDAHDKKFYHYYDYFYFYYHCCYYHYYYYHFHYYHFHYYHYYYYYYYHSYCDDSDDDEDDDNSGGDGDCGGGGVGGGVGVGGGGGDD